MITLRLDPDLEKTINNTAKNLGQSKSELIRRSIIEYLAKLHKADSWEVGKDLFGKYSSDLSNLSTNRKELLKDRIQAKRK